MSSLTLDIVEELESSKASHAGDDVHAQLLEEAKKDLVPLSADDQAWLDKARATQDAPPEAANAAADQLETGTFLTELDTFDAGSVAKVISEFSKGGVFTVFETVSENAQPAPLKSDSANTMDSVRAANDDWGAAAYSVFETDIMKEIIGEHALRINAKADSAGRTFFNFDNGVNINLTAVVFEMKGVRMVKLQNTILSLDSLLSVKRCVNLLDVEKKEGLLTLRSSPTFQGGVECTFEDDVTLIIPGISVDSMMVIVSHLSQVYAHAVELEEGPPEAKPVAQQQQQPQPTGEDDLAIVISHAVIGFASLFMGIIIGRYTA